MIEPLTAIWRPRSLPLTPVAAAGSDAVAVALARRLLASDPEQLGYLEGVASRDIILVLGAEDRLPWVPGLQYLGRDPAAPRLLLPTNLEPDVPSDLLDQALSRRHLRAPLAVLPLIGAVVPADAKRTLHATRLHAWLDARG